MWVSGFAGYPQSSGLWETCNTEETKSRTSGSGLRREGRRLQMPRTLSAATRGSWPRTPGLIPEIPLENHPFRGPRVSRESSSGQQWGGNNAESGGTGNPPSKGLINIEGGFLGRLARDTQAPLRSPSRPPSPPTPGSSPPQLQQGLRAVSTRPEISPDRWQVGNFQSSRQAEEGVVCSGCGSLTHRDRDTSAGQPRRRVRTSAKNPAGEALHGVARELGSSFKGEKKIKWCGCIWFRNDM